MQRFEDSTALPQAMACYRHNGNYCGEFRSMAALGALLRRSLEIPGVVMRTQETSVFAEDLHLRGELWTFDLADSINVFTTPHSLSDAALARLRPPRAVGCTRDQSTSPVL